MSIKACFPFFILISLLVPVVEASVIEVEITPVNPVKGDMVIILIKAEPDEELSVKISHTIEANVSDGKYEYGIDGITIPSSVNSITGKAFNVKNLHLSVKMLIWITESVEAVDGVATISQSNVKEGAYDIKISGDALEDASRVTLKVNASMAIVTDQEGHYEYALNTESLPPGTFTAQVGEITKEITLLPHQVELEPQISDLQLRISLLEEEIATLKTEKSALGDSLNRQIYDLDKSRSLWQIISVATFITGIIIGISANYMLRRR